MDSQALEYYSTSAQILPVVAVAAAVELRYLVRRLYQSNGTMTRARPLVRLSWHLYLRILAGCSFAAVLLTVQCVYALETGKSSELLRDALPYVLTVTVVLVGMPLFGAIFSPARLTDWYGRDLTPGNNRAGGPRRSSVP